MAELKKVYRCYIENIHKMNHEKQTRIYTITGRNTRRDSGESKKRYFEV